MYFPFLWQWHADCIMMHHLVMTCYGRGQTMAFAISVMSGRLLGHLCRWFVAKLVLMPLTELG
jgi:hypothetical protein